MADILETIFKNKSVNFDKLKSFGFTKNGETYSFSKVLNSDGFILTVTVSPLGKVSTNIIDPEYNEVYTLHLADGAIGKFVGNIKMQYEDILKDIAMKCFEPDIFKSEISKRIISFVRQEYGDELEYLWSKFPNNAIWRRKDNSKWYAALLSISKHKLGINSDEIVEIIDLRISQNDIEDLIDNKKYYPGYHMNKKHWYTIILDGSVSYDEICKRIKESYILAGKK